MSKKYTTYMSPKLLPPELVDRRNFVVRQIQPLLRALDPEVAYTHYTVQPTGAESGAVEWMDGRKVRVPLDLMMDRRAILGAYLRAAGIRL